MNPAGVILVFALLALLVALGIVLTALGAVKLRQPARSGFSKRAAVMRSRGGILVAAGLTSAACGIAGGCRILWGA